MTIVSYDSALQLRAPKSRHYLSLSATFERASRPRIASSRGFARPLQRRRKQKQRQERRSMSARMKESRERRRSQMMMSVWRLRRLRRARMLGAPRFVACQRRRRRAPRMCFTWARRSLRSNGSWMILWRRYGFLKSLGLKLTFCHQT